MSPRPGRIVDEIDIPLPRPRTRATMANPVFTSLCDQLRRHFTVEGRGIE
jgi:NitT/TauT family transport system ATP-binding protein